MFAGADNGLDATLYSQFAKDMVDVGFDCARGDDQAGRDLRVGKTICHQLQDFQFAGTERLYQSGDFGMRGYPLGAE